MVLSRPAINVGLTGRTRLGTIDKPKRLVSTILGGYSTVIGDEIGLWELTQLARAAGLSDAASRTTINGMVNQGLLQRASDNGYKTLRRTERLHERIEHAARRIYTAQTPAKLSDGWVVVTFSIPETERAMRHQLRVGLEDLCMGCLNSAFWIGPSRLRSEVIETIKSLKIEDMVDVFTSSYDGLSHITGMVSRCWDLESIASFHHEFINVELPVLKSWRRSSRIDPEKAYYDFTLALHHWRGLPFIDPMLPLEVLPANWPGQQSMEVFFELRERLESSAMQYCDHLSKPK